MMSERVLWWIIDLEPSIKLILYEEKIDCLGATVFREHPGNKDQGLWTRGILKRPVDPGTGDWLEILSGHEEKMDSLDRRHVQNSVHDRPVIDHSL